MASISLSSDRLTALAAPALLWIGVAVAQAPGQPPASDGPKPGQPTPSSVERQEALQAGADNSRSAADAKVRASDRRLDRVLRSVCSGC